mmetsp:Transcript_8486/g.17176  ORF Transcript_8486/g.17176 Transcript_8486/m.17176 type:complete len:256 (+) Transcript_8486:166-933(+)
MKKKTSVRTLLMATSSEGQGLWTKISMALGRPQSIIQSWLTWRSPTKKTGGEEMMMMTTMMRWLMLERVLLRTMILRKRLGTSWRLLGRRMEVVLPTQGFLIVSLTTTRGSTTVHLMMLTVRATSCLMDRLWKRLSWRGRRRSCRRRLPRLGRRKSSRESPGDAGGTMLPLMLRQRSPPLPPLPLRRGGTRIRRPRRPLRSHAADAGTLLPRPLPLVRLPRHLAGTRPLLQLPPRSALVGMRPQPRVPPRRLLPS